MASSKLIASSVSRSSELNLNMSSCSSVSGATDLTESEISGSARDYLVPLDVFLRNSSVESNSSPAQHHQLSVGEAKCSSSGTLLHGETNFLHAAGDEVSRKMVRKTAEEVWQDIMRSKKNLLQPKEELMTLEDFLVKAAADEDQVAGANLEVKEERFSREIFSYKGSGVVEMGIGMGLDFGDLGSGRGKRTLSMLEPLDKAAQQRQRRMIKNRESAARSRERKQAYQVELESMVAKLEQENERLFKEKEELAKKRLKQIMENVIPVVEKKKPLHLLRKTRSMLW